jgi:hypothetical protein
MASRRSGALSAFLIGLVAATTVLAGCQSDTKASGTGPGSSAGSDKDGGSKPTTTISPALVAFTPANGATKVRPDKTVKIKVSQGTLEAVTVTTKSGKKVSGALSDDKLTWESESKLVPSTKYNVSVEAAATDGTKKTTTSSFKTLTPKSTANAYIQPGDGWVVGVGMPVVVNFSRSVSTKNRDDVEAALTVKTTKDVEGAWRWITDQQVQWRPAKYWPANTKVQVTSNLSGVELQPGVWGTDKRTSDFDLGTSVISAVEFAITIAPPMPCTTRQMMISSAPAAPPLGTSAQPRAPTVKTAKPRLNTFALPYWSPSRPNVTTSTAVTSMKPISIQSR